MKKYLLLASLLTHLSSMVPAHSDGFRSQIIFSIFGEEAGDSIEERIRAIYENLSSQTNQNAVVLERFNRLIDFLNKLYRQERALSESDFSLILDAIEFAEEKHRFQTRKNVEKTPYISHLFGVTNYLLEIGEVKTPSVLIGGLLHDTIEDTNTTYEELNRLFGKEVENLVRELSSDKRLSKEERKRAQIIDAPKKSVGSAQINLADHLYNLKDLFNNPPKQWRREQIDLYFVWVESVANRLPTANPSLKAALDQTIRQYWDAQSD